MQNFYLVRWLKEQSGLDPDIIDSLKFELDKRMYYYGRHFSAPHERSAVRKQCGLMKNAVKEAIAPLRQLSGSGSASAAQGGKIVSSAYFNLNLALAEADFSVFSPPWLMSRGELDDDKLYDQIRRIEDVLQNCDFKALLSPELASEIIDFRAGLKLYYQRHNIAALILPFDLPFFERMSIKIFKELGRPSFVSMHGLPGRYNSHDDNRADYLLVWGEKIKEYYVRAGINPAKIFVTGHPAYNSISVSGTRFSLENVLVITKPMSGAQHSAEENLSDRGNSILYLYQIQKALKKLGVQSVKFRPHPSESGKWYTNFLDDKFFVWDKGPLRTSLDKASLVIGPTSTVFLESLLAGVNYLVYEPCADGRDLMNYAVVPPFDGSEHGVPVARNEEELDNMLVNGPTVDLGVLPGYIKTPFGVEVVKNLIHTPVVGA